MKTLGPLVPADESLNHQINAGQMAKRLGPPRREPVAARAHRDRYGTAW
jgi:hypothetical protein